MAEVATSVATWSAWAPAGSPYLAEAISGALHGGVVGFQLGPHTGDFAAATFPLQHSAEAVSGSYPWTPPPGVRYETRFEWQSITSVSVSDAPGGPNNASVGYTLSGQSLIFNNTSPVPLWVTSIRGMVQLYFRTQVTTEVPVAPPAGPTQPPTVLPPTLPPVDPVQVIQRKRLDAANPGYIVEWTQRNQDRLPDLVSHDLGERGNLSVPMAGFTGRGHIITGMELHFVAETDPVAERISVVTTLEKIPGTLLPGAGTSNDAQDDAGNGGELSLFLIWDDTTTGWDLGAWS